MDELEPRRWLRRRPLLDGLKGAGLREACKGAGLREACKGACIVAVLAGLLATLPIRAAGDAEAGAKKAALCAACHGSNGISINPLWPSLAGQQEVYLAKQIKAFRDGERTEPTMQPFVANLTDQDIDDLAAYYASLSPCP